MAHHAGSVEDIRLIGIGEQEVQVFQYPAKSRQPENGR